MAHSPLATEYVPAYTGNFTYGRQKPLEKITLHHTAGVISAHNIGLLWQAQGRKGSSHYGIGTNGEIAYFVEEENTAWTDSNWDSNCKSITIETSNDSTGGEWHISDNSLNALIKLCADIAKRNGFGKLVAGQNLTWHSMYSATTCPGDYMRSRMGYICEQANLINYPPKKPITWEDYNKNTIALTGTKLYNIETGKVIKEYSEGENIQIAQKATYDGVDYGRTEYSKQNSINNGFKLETLLEINEEKMVEQTEETEQKTNEEEIKTPIDFKDYEENINKLKEGADMPFTLPQKFYEVGRWLLWLVVPAVMLFLGLLNSTLELGWEMDKINIIVDGTCVLLGTILGIAKTSNDKKE